MAKQKSSSLDDFLEDKNTVTEELQPFKPEPPSPTKQEYKKRKFQREMPDTSGLTLSKQLLPPITRRRMAIYQLLSADIKFDGRVVSGPNLIEPAPFEMHPIYEIYDPGEPVLAKRRKRMVYSNDIAIHEYANTNSAPIDPNTNTRIEMPQFIHGQVSIDSVKEFMKYCWYELHPQNLTNKYRDKTKVARFKRVDIEFQSPHIQLMQRDLAIDAERLVISLSTEQLINLAAAFGVPSTTRPSDMRLEMRKKASQSPKEVLFKSPDNRATSMMNIMSALDLGILDFDPDTQNYYLGDDREPIWQCLVDQSPLEDFAKFLVSDEGKDVKKEIESLLSFWQ